MNRQWQKMLALLVLALALIDVAGVCPVDDRTLASDSGAALSAAVADSAGPFDALLGLGDGCFCSCAHMILAPSLFMNVFLRSVAVEAPPAYAALDGPPHSLYHPPRS